LDDEPRHKTPQSIARIARTARNVVFCRTFSRAVLLLVIDRHGMDTDRSHKYRPLIDRIEMWWFTGISTP
jgi:hypothetical protein